MYRPNHPADGPALILPSPLPAPPRREKPCPVTPPPAPPPALAGKKRSAPDDEIEELDAPSAKRSRTDAGAGGLPFTPSKKRRLEEDGLIMLENEGEKIEEDRDPDVIEID